MLNIYFLFVSYITIDDIMTIPSSGHTSTYFLFLQIKRKMDKTSCCESHALLFSTGKISSYNDMYWIDLLQNSMGKFVLLRSMILKPSRLVPCYLGCIWLWICAMIQIKYTWEYCLKFSKRIRYVIISPFRLFNLIQTVN